MSEDELVRRMAQHEKNERVWGRICLICFVVGLIGFILSMASAEAGALAVISIPLFIIGFFYFFFIRGRSRDKAISMLNDYLKDFYDTELERAFGPCEQTGEMTINDALIKELRPLKEQWDESNTWRFYEGDYHGIHFSVENVILYKTHSDQDGTTRDKMFDGTVMRFRNVCPSSLNIALSGSGSDHRNDLTDPDVFRQCFSARNAENQPVDHAVTPQLRELVQKMEAIGNRYTVTAMIFRDGEAILSVRGYNFGHGLPSGGGSLQDISGIRSRFIESLTPLCTLVDILRDSCGEM